MFAHYFWMYCLVFWLYSMLGFFWSPPRRTCIPPMALYNMLWCSGLDLYSAYFGLGRGTWNTLMGTCFSQSCTNDGMNALCVDLINVIIYFLPLHWLGYFWQWLNSGFTRPCVCAMVRFNWFVILRPKYESNPQVVLFSYSSCYLVYFMLWLKACWFDPLLRDAYRSFENLGIFHLTVSSYSSLLTLTWLWWQVPGDIQIHFQPLTQRPIYIFYLDQHVYMLRMHLCMPSQPLYRGWILSSMMITYIFISDILFGLHVPRAFPSLLLSLSAACLYAQKHVAWPMCFCWYHAWLSRQGDEKKGMVPFVYEDNCSETSPYLYYAYVCFLSSWWLISGTQQISCLCAFKTTMQPSSTASLTVVKYSLYILTEVLAVLIHYVYLTNQDHFRLLWLYFVMYWVYMLVSLPSLIVIHQIVRWISVASSYLFSACSLWIERFVAKHGYMLRLCPLALEQHPSMLGLARRGPGIAHISWSWTNIPLATIITGNMGFYGLLYLLWSLVSRESRSDSLLYHILT